MIETDWAHQVIGLFSLLLGAGIVALCLVIYARLLKAVRAGKGKVWADPLGLPDLLVCAALASWLGGAAVHGFLRNAPSPAVTDKTLLASLIIFGVVICAITLFLKARRISVLELFGLWPAHPAAVLKRGAGLFIAALPLVVVCFQIVQLVLRQEVQPQEITKFFSEAARQSDWRRVMLATGLASLAAPVMEEFIFRGYFYGVLRRYLGVVPALLFTSALFAAIHLSGPFFLPLFVLATCLTLAYEATGSLLAPMLMHALFNSVNLAMVFLARNP